MPRTEGGHDAVTDTGFVEMRLGRVAGIMTADGEPCCCVVLDAMSEDRHLPIEIAQTEAFNLSATLTGQEFARPMSPQFAAGLLRALGGRIRRVRIDRLVTGNRVRRGAGGRPAQWHRPLTPDQVLNDRGKAAA